MTARLSKTGRPRPAKKIDLDDSSPVKPMRVKRLLWIDISKGLAILFVAYFHFFTTYFQHGVLPPPDWTSIAASTLTILRLAWLKISGLGFHAVGVFIILSGWTLMQSTTRRAEAGPIAWGAWYCARFLRLYPMYWVAHLVYLVSPFVARLEPGRRSHYPESARASVHRYPDELHVSQRGVVVFLHADPILFDLSPALLDCAPNRALAVSANRMRRRFFRALRAARALAAKRIVGARRLRNLSLTGICTRDVARNVVHAITSALGMVPPSRRWIRSWANSLSCGVAAVSWSFSIHFCRFRYWRVLPAGNCRNRQLDFAISGLCKTVRPRWALFVRPVSHSPAVRHLARPPHSRSADLGISVDLHPGAGCPRRLGHALGKRNQRLGEQAAFSKETSACLRLRSDQLNARWLSAVSFLFHQGSVLAFLPAELLAHARPVAVLPDHQTDSAINPDP